MRNGRSLRNIGMAVVMWRVQKRKCRHSFHHFVVPLPLGGRLLTPIAKDNTKDIQ